MAKSNVYVVFDEVADDVILVGMCKTDGLFVRQNLPYISKINENYKNDLKVYRIGEIADSSLLISSYDKPVSVSWDSYVRPESVEPPLKLNDVSHC